MIDLRRIRPRLKTGRCWNFFETSERHLLPAEVSAGVPASRRAVHRRVDRTDNGYFRAKLAEEKLIEASVVPYTIVRATQFMEFLGGIADSGMRWKHQSGFRLSCSSRSRRTTSPPTSPRSRLRRRGNGVVEIAGPERAPFNEIVARYLKAIGDPAAGCRRSRGPILGRPGRGALARAARRSAPRPHRAGRMAARPSSATANRRSA